VTLAAVHHLITSDVDEIIRAVPSVEFHRDELNGRAMLCRRTDVFPVECVVRGFLVGSGWKDYQKSGAVCGIGLAPGLRESERLEPAIFTPSISLIIDGWIRPMSGAQGCPVQPLGSMFADRSPNG